MHGSFGYDLTSLVDASGLDKLRERYFGGERSAGADNGKRYGSDNHAGVRDVARGSRPTPMERQWARAASSLPERRNESGGQAH